MTRTSAEGCTTEADWDNLRAAQHRLALQVLNGAELEAYMIAYEAEALERAAVRHAEYVAWKVEDDAREAARDQRDNIEARELVERIGEELFAVLNGNAVYYPEAGEFYPRPVCDCDDNSCDACATNPDDYEEADLLTWLRDMGVEVLCDREGNPRRVEVTIGGGGPCIWTEGNDVRFEHHPTTARYYVPGLHDALLELAEEGCI
jgi:hypothetical protein